MRKKTFKNLGEGGTLQFKSDNYKTAGSMFSAIPTPFTQALGSGFNIIGGLYGQQSQQALDTEKKKSEQLIAHNLKANQDRLILNNYPSQGTVTTMYPYGGELPDEEISKNNESYFNERVKEIGYARALEEYQQAFDSLPSFVKAIEPVNKDTSESSPINFDVKKLKQKVNQKKRFTIKD